MSSQGAMADLCVPDDLAELDQWVLWRSEVRGGQKTKVPYTVKGRRASVTSPGDWSTFETALSVWRRYPKGYAGLGFVFSKADPFTGIDLDDCLQVGEGAAHLEPKAWVRGILERFSDTYMEISPSGTGLKIWVRGALPENLSVKAADGALEAYSAGRYFTVTGRVFRGAPLQIEDHAADLKHLHEKLRGGKAAGWPVQPLADGRIPYGQQHNTLVSIAGTLWRRRVCGAAIEACLLKMAELQCERAMTHQHIADIVKSIERSWGAR